MNFKFKQWATALLFATLGSANCWAQDNPQGLVTCRIGSTPVAYTTTYVSGGANSVALSVPISCTQTLATANNSNVVIVTVNIGDGLSPSLNQNRATGTGSPINYDFYTNSGCTTETHGSTNPPPAVTVTIPTRNGTGTGNALIYGCVPVPLPAAMGLYTDTVATSIPVGGVVSTGSAAVAVGASGVINVKITIPEFCAITMPAGALAFTYTSFTGVASQATKTYSVTCGSSLLPTMALTDVNGAALTSGAAAGLAYTLALNTLSNSTGGTATLPAAATGSATTYRINGNMLAGQAGSCGAPAVQAGSLCTQTITGVHYVTVTW